MPGSLRARPKATSRLGAARWQPALLAVLGLHRGCPGAAAWAAVVLCHSDTLPLVLCLSGNVLQVAESNWMILCCLLGKGAAPCPLQFAPAQPGNPLSTFPDSNQDSQQEEVKLIFKQESLGERKQLQNQKKMSKICGNVKKLSWRGF